jgi:hypothetical protein
MFSIILVAVLIGCGKQNNYNDRYFDYSGEDGCIPPNIGHALGGDLPDHMQNSLEGMNAIADLQSSRCFKNWELDLNQSQDYVVLSHDGIIEGVALETIETKELPTPIVSLDAFVSAFVKLKLSKPLIFDIKNVSNPEFWPELRQAARKIRDFGGIPVWFTLSEEASESHVGICSFMNGEFDVMLYPREGPMCKQ